MRIGADPNSSGPEQETPMAEIPAAFADLMRNPRAFAHLATVSPNGAPQVTPV